MVLLRGKRYLITGVTNERSIAFGIASALHREGAELHFACQNEKVHARTVRLVEQLTTHEATICDVRSDEDIATLAEHLKTQWSDGFDGFVHSIAYVPPDALKGSYVESVTREFFAIAHDVSAYSFSALAKAFRSQLRTGAALLTLSYLGAEVAVPHYNVMGLAKASLEASVRYLAASLGASGIRVNAISAGPIKTLAASGIQGFSALLKYAAQNTPLQGKTVSLESLGNAALFLMSPWSEGITGEILHVDGGLSTTIMQAGAEG